MRFFKSFLFALNGVKICLLSEINFRIHVVAAIAAAAAGIYFHVSAAEWLAIAFCTALVLVTEMLNTAVEMLCNLVTKEFNPAIKKIKDTAAGAVLVAAVMSAVCGGLIFIPKLAILLKQFYA